MRRRCCFLLLACFLITTVALSSGVRPAAEDSFNLRGVDGRTYALSQMRGEVVVLSFGATWCRPCAAELAAIEDLKREYRDRHVRFFWVTIETENEKSDAVLREYARSLRLTIPVLRDPTRTTFAQFSDRMRIPMVVFFDRNGRFSAPAQTGMSARPEEYKRAMRARLDALLGRASDERRIETRLEPRE